ncbi:9520_t:CDS:2 [Entrophospora sp. SA101]|nr:9520_t:CDS:2 [Entrophospora sp. SA101]CAJ0847607.1 2829_t:CDS:2 [Entrophospora sp. SA101]
MERMNQQGEGGKYEHLLKHVNVIVRANPAGAMYLFQSKKVLFRYSEDLNFSLEADRMMGLAAKMGTKLVDGRIAQTTLGSISSILDASHTHGNYSLGEIALRLEFNKNLCHRYQETKSMLKKSGNQIFNTRKFGNILSKGYYKIIPHIFEKDEEGYFARIFSQGVYIYEGHPRECFLEEGERGEFERGILNRDPVMVNTTIQENYSSSIGRDDLVHVDDMRQSEATLTRGVQYEWFMHAFSSGQQDSRAFRGLDDGVKVILKQDGADWELAFIGRVEITETIGNPDNIGSGVEIDDPEEVLPELEDEAQTEGLEEAEQNMEPEAEQQNQNDKELQEELEQQAEPEQQKEDEQQEELEQEDEQHKEKHKEKKKEKQKQEEKQDEQQQQQDPEYSGEQEKDKENFDNPCCQQCRYGKTPQEIAIKWQEYEQSVMSGKSSNINEQNTNQSNSDSSQSKSENLPNQTKNNPSSNKPNTALYIGLAIAGVALIGIIAYFLTRKKE